MYSWLEEIKTQPSKKPFPILSFPGIQHMDGLTVRELVCSAELQAQCMKKVADLTDSLASVSLMDLSLEAEAFGAKIRFADIFSPKTSFCPSICHYITFYLPAQLFFHSRRRTGCSYSSIVK